MSLLGALATLALLWTVPTAATLLLGAGLKRFGPSRSGPAVEAADDSRPSG